MCKSPMSTLAIPCCAHPHSLVVHLVRPGLWVTIGAQIFTMVLVGTLTLFNTRTNRKLDNREVPLIQGIEGFRYSI
jgi:hypothetical protein